MKFQTRDTHMFFYVLTFLFTLFLLRWEIPLVKKNKRYNTYINYAEGILRSSRKELYQSKFMGVGGEV